jgi:hypothetical protein
MIFSHFHGKKAGSEFVPSGTPFLWYDADSITGLNDNDAIANVPDLSGNNLHLLQAEPTDKPVFKTGIQNGLPAIRLDTNVKWMAVAVDDKSQPNTIFCVVKVTAPVSGRYIFDGIAGGRNALYTPETPQQYGLYAGNQVSSGDVIDGNAHVLTCLFNGGSSTIRLDGVQIYTGDAGALALGDFQIGRGNTSSSVCDIFEIVVYDGNESPAANEAALATKWGI